MSLKDDLDQQVRETFRAQWDVQDAIAVPNPADLRLDANHAKELGSAAVLYADIDGSTTMVDTMFWTLSAEVYKTYLRCAGQLIRSEGGVITAYDGDRIMAVFTDSNKETTAVRCALKITYAVRHIIQPALKNQYPNSTFILKHVVGVDVSMLRAARIGVRGDNDLVWIGRAANYAAKLTAIKSGFPTWITSAVYGSISDAVKYCNGTLMWEKRLWTEMNNLEIYCTSYHHTF